MVEILLTVYISSFICSWILIGWYVWSVQRNFKSEKLRKLDINLAKVGKYWANSCSSFEPLTDGCVVLDQKKSIRSFLLMGFLLSLLSFLGFVLLSCVVVSLKFLARSRLEKKVFQSALCSDENLTAGQVQQLITEFDHI